MGKIKTSFSKSVKIFFGCLFALTCFFSIPSVNTHAEPVNEPTYIQENSEGTSNQNETESPVSEQLESSTDENQTIENQNDTTNSQTCEDALQSLAWIVCPGTGVLSRATDWLYEKIEEILVINPISMDDGSPIYEIWKYCRGLTNIVFCIFLLIVIYSQLTGFGISNYGVKKALPKLIIAAILVNLSFVICSVCVDVSNIIGMSLRGLFTSVEEATLATSNIEWSGISFAGMNALVAGGGAITIVGTVIAVQSGAIWLLIPIVLGAVVAVFSGLVTIALRQAVVILLIMISPLAFVALILPNTEPLFNKWKKLLYKMLIFYPAFSLLFGASNLAGWAIIISAKDVFAVLLGLAVQVFPLFFSWKLMRMSGTFLESINSTIRNIANRPLAASRAMANSQYDFKKQKYLATSNRAFARLSRYLENRRVAQELEKGEYANVNKGRSAASYALSRYDKNGRLNRAGQRSYEMQTRATNYQRMLAMDQNNFKQGFGGLSEGYYKDIARLKKDFHNDSNAFSNKIEGKTYNDRIKILDAKSIVAGDNLSYEATRGASIEYENAKGRYERTNDAINAYMDRLNINNPNYEQSKIKIGEREDAEKRYNSILSIMEGKVDGVHFAGADAAYSFNSQAQVVQGKFERYFKTGLPSASIVRRLQDFTLRNDVSDNMDIIVSGLRILNQYGDTDVVKDRLYEICEAPDGTKKLELGTYASQALASFCMFDVKDSDPILRRFGKYINVETARIYNEGDPRKRRHNANVTYNEYVNGEYEEYDVDENGNVLTTTHTARPKYSAVDLLHGTSFKGMERTAIANMTESIRNASYDVDENGNKRFNIEKFKETQEKFWEAIMPNIVGDQFAFLSGSEQIKALAKGITGVDADKHSFDWDGIFGKELASTLTDDQKRDYIKFLDKRTNAFLGGHVPNQIARTKSDMLGSVMNFFTMSAAAEENGGLINEGRISDDDYEEIERRYGLKADDKLLRSLKHETLLGFLKMYHKGYQGDTKANLAKHLHAEELYERYFGNSNQQGRRQQQTNDDDDEGIAVVYDDGSVVDDIDAIVHQATIENIYMENQAAPADEFYSRAMEYLNNNHLSSVARDFDNYYRNDSTASSATLFNRLKDLI